MKRSFKNIKELSPIGKLFFILGISLLGCVSHSPKSQYTYANLIRNTISGNESFLRAFIEAREGHRIPERKLLRSYIDVLEVIGPDNAPKGYKPPNDTLCILEWRTVSDSDNSIIERFTFQPGRSCLINFLNCRHDSVYAHGERMTINEKKKVTLELITNFKNGVACSSCTGDTFNFCNIYSSDDISDYQAIIRYNGKKACYYSSPHLMNYSYGSQYDGTGMYLKLYNDTIISSEGNCPSDLDTRINTY